MIDTQKLKKYILPNIPLAIFAYIGNKIFFAYRTASESNFSEKAAPFLNNFLNSFSNIMPSFNIIDLLGGLAVAAAMKLVLYIRAKSKKNFRQGVEYGSASWGTSKDIEPYIDRKDPKNNIIFSQTEMLTMGKPSAFKYSRNKNVLIIGGSGSGKTFKYVKPNLMQMHSSYVVTDPKGTVLIDCGHMLLHGKTVKSVDRNGKPCKKRIGYKIKVFNTIDFEKSMHYNPFAYISEKNREKDILKFVDVLIKNTNGNKPTGGDDFWEKAEKLYYTACIALIFTLYEEDERNFISLIDMINSSECREDDENFKNSVDIQFMFTEWMIEGFPDDWQEQIENAGVDPEVYKIHKEKFPFNEEQIRIGSFAVKQYKAYKLAAGKTAKSILISCSTRLAPFSIDEVLEITRYDELELDKLGDRLTALFVIISDTDATFNFLVAIMYSQMFNLLCTKADNSDGGRLHYHVRCILDEFANIGEIPNFDKLIATIRSREISANIILQTKSQLKAIYKDNAETIEGNCDTTVFLGGKEKTTRKELAEDIGKATIDMYNTSENRGQSQSYGLSYQKLGRELMSQDELNMMDGDKCIVQIRGVKPFFSNKYNTVKHPNYGLLYDGKKNYFDIKKFVSKAQIPKAKFRETDKIDVVDMSVSENN